MLLTLLVKLGACSFHTALRSKSCRADEQCRYASSNSLGREFSGYSLWARPMHRVLRRSTCRAFYQRSRSARESARSILKCIATAEFTTISTTEFSAHPPTANRPRNKKTC